ncbi:hypothetical protein J6590_053084 [Homalodisca vitripennis]|nr:hypothetical protein J6590_053084 [Homalodisca vitripennis]
MPSKFPCGNCDIGVKFSGILCTGLCKKWYHVGCQNILERNFKKWTKVEIGKWQCTNRLSSCVQSKTELEHAACNTSEIKTKNIQEVLQISITSPQEVNSTRGNELLNSSFSNSRTKILNDSLVEIENSLVENNLLETTNNDEKLEIAAKIGSTLLEKNKHLEEENLRLAATILSMEEKIEKFENSELKHLSRIETLTEELIHCQSQLRKEKEFQIEMQNIFEEQDKKSQHTIDLNLNKIKNLELTVDKLQRNKMESLNKLETFKNPATQTSEESTLPATPKPLSTHTELVLLKSRQDKLEQLVKTLSENIQHKSCKELESIIPASPTTPFTTKCSNKANPSSYTSLQENELTIKTKRRNKKRNAFSVSLQVVKSQEANLKLQALNINRKFDDTLESSDEDKPTKLVTAPLIHRYEDGSLPTLNNSKTTKTHLDRVKIKNSIDKQNGNADTARQILKQPPVTAKLLSINETLEDFLNKHIDTIKASKLDYSRQLKKNIKNTTYANSDRTTGNEKNPKPTQPRIYRNGLSAQENHRESFLAHTKMINTKYKTRHFFNATRSRIK